MGQKTADDAVGGESGDDEDAAEAGDDPASFRELLGPNCVIRRVDKDQKFLSEAKPEEMQRELMSRASTQKRLGACAEHVQGMSRMEKLNWAVQMKDEANQYYHNLKFEEAARLYNDCLVALDFGGTEEEKREVVEKLQLPVCTNLAACTIEMGRYERCLDICNLVLNVRPKCAKALYRRGLALYRLGDHRGARSDFEAALREAQADAACHDEGERGEEAMPPSERKALDDLIRRATVYLHNIHSYDRTERDRCQRMFDQSLYADRPDAKPTSGDEEVAPPVDDSDEAIEAALAEARGDWPCCRRHRRGSCCSRRRSDTGAQAGPDAPTRKDKNV